MERRLLVCDVDGHLVGGGGGITVGYVDGVFVLAVLDEYVYWLRLWNLG